MKKNYKSDFDIILRLRTCVGSGDEIRELGWPDYDWTARFYTSNKANAYTASCIGGVCTNCFEDKGQIHVVFDSHRLGVGLLQVEFLAELPNRIYPDETQTEVSPQPLGIELVSGPGDCGTTAEVEVLPSYIKGDTGPKGPKGDKGEAFNYDDFTPAQIEELQRPATEAAERADEAADNAQSVADKYASVLEDKADRAELSNIIAVEPLTDDNFPGIDPYTREELKMDLFIDLWNSAAGAYGKYDPRNAPDTQHPFYLNGLWLTYAEALNVYIHSGGRNNQCFEEYTMSRFSVAGSAILTNIPPTSYTNMSFNRSFFGCQKMVVAHLGSNKNPKSFYQAFNRCVSLKEIIGDVIFSGQLTGTFGDCRQLEEFRLSQLSYPINLVHSPKISYATINHLIKNAANKSPITITVHSDVYAKLTDESNTEWYALLSLAAEKNITFATV